MEGRLDMMEMYFELKEMDCGKNQSGSNDKCNAKWIECGSNVEVATSISSEMLVANRSSSDVVVTCLEW